MSRSAGEAILVGFVQAQNCTNFVASWRHPEHSTGFLTADYYAHIGRVLEKGCFHLALFDDRLAMPEYHGGSYEDAVRDGVRCVKLDPFAALMPLAMATSRLGVGATLSTSYHAPFHAARLFQSMDHMTDGRMAWNIVTSLNSVEARNMGRADVIPHDERYDRADEFLEIVLGHWNGWDDEALVVDRSNGVFADPERVRRLDYRGRFLASRGPFTVPRSPQGHPVLIQAGQSTRGLRFAADWAELVFAVFPDIATARQQTDRLRELARERGREPDDIAIIHLCQPIVAETREAAEQKRSVIAELPTTTDSLLLLSEALNLDFGGRSLDEPFTDAELNAMTGWQSLRDRTLTFTEGRSPSVRDFISATQRGRLRNPWVGTGADIADRMEEWMTEGGCDGFAITASHVPGSYEGFVQWVVPELQRRGRHPKAYRGRTLRDHLGMPRPAASGAQVDTGAAQPAR
ncbi:MAG: NtaA/DmoA family FMN-dependent monooxygenase [Pseudomonadota bacterium]